jgi:hypothetical protein
MKFEDTIFRFQSAGRLGAEIADWLRTAYRQELLKHGDRLLARQSTIHLLERAREVLLIQGELTASAELGALAAELMRTQPSTAQRVGQALLGGLIGAALATFAVLAFFFLLLLLIEIVFGSPASRVRIPAKAVLAVILAPIAGAIIGGLYGWNLNAGEVADRLRNLLDRASIFDRAWIAWSIVWSGGTLAAFTFFKPFSRSSISYWRSDDWLSFAAIWIFPILGGWLIAKLVRWVVAGKLE